MHDRNATVWRVLAALGIEDVDILPLGAGLASEAWRVGRVPTWYALRIAREWPGAGSTYQMEHALMALLTDAGARVPGPLRGSWEVDGWKGRSFSLTLGLDGSPLAPADRARAVPAVAAFLRTLHGLAIGGYGALTVVDDRLVGEASDMATGLQRWAQRQLWPLGDARLDVHPALGKRPDLVARLDSYADRVRGALLRGPGVPLHSDLHDENILDEDGVLGFIDFGEALVGPAAWEFAAIAYFLDWPTAEAVLAAYLDEGRAVDPWHRDTAAIGLCFGVYRWAQDRELGVDDDDHDETFLLETLSRM